MDGRATRLLKLWKPNLLVSRSSVAAVTVQPHAVTFLAQLSVIINKPPPTARFDPPKEIFRVSLTLVFVKVTSSSDYEELDDGDSTLARLDPSFPPVPSIHSSSSKQHRAFANIAVATDADMPNPAVNSFGTFLIIGRKYRVT